MVKRRFDEMSTVALIVGAAVGFAGPTSLASGQGAAAIAPASDLNGTWYGTFGQVAAALYEDEGKAVLEIKEDGTFTAKITSASACRRAVCRS